MQIFVINCGLDFVFRGMSGVGMASDSLELTVYHNTDTSPPLISEINSLISLIHVLSKWLADSTCAICSVIIVCIDLSWSFGRFIRFRGIRLFYLQVSIFLLYFLVFSSYRAQ